MTVATLLLAALGIFSYRQESSVLSAELRKRAATLSDQAAAALTLPLWNYDRPQIDRVIESLMTDRTVHAILVRQNDVSSAGGTAVFGRMRNAEGSPVAAETLPPAEGMISDTRTVIAPDEPIGNVTVVLTTQFLEEQRHRDLVRLATRIILLDLALVISLFLLLWFIVLRPLQQLERYAVAVKSDVGSNEPPPASRFRGELTSLRQCITQMVELLGERFRAMQKQQQMLTGVLNSVPQCIFWKDQNSVYLGCNDVFAAKAGLPSPQAIAGKTDFDLPWLRSDAEHYRANDQDVIAGKVTQSRVVEPFTTAAGERAWVETTKVRLIGADHVPYGVLGIFDDVTERIKAAEATKRQIAFDELITAILAGFASATGGEADLQIKFALEMLARFFGVNYTFVVEFSEGMGLWSVTHAWHEPNLTDHPQRFLRKPMGTAPWAEKMIARGEIIQANNLDELPPEAASERARWAELGFQSVLQVPLRGKGARIRGCLCLNSIGKQVRWQADDAPRLRLIVDGLANVLERIRAEQALRVSEENTRALNRELEHRVRERTADLEAANKELEAFSYSVSHDLRAPLRAISGFARMLAEDFGESLPAEGRRFLSVINDNIRQMGSLIDDLLTFSRLGRQPLHKDWIRPQRMIEEVIEQIRSAEPEGRRVDVSIAELPPCEVDPALFRQVVTNLISNAFKYTRKNPSARIEIGYQPPQDGTPGAYFFRDNGAGFDMRYVEKLFHVFQRLHSSADYEGTGVGLAIVRRIIDRHGGSVWASAQVDRGATFFVSLPGVVG